MLRYHALNIKHTKIQCPAHSPRDDAPSPSPRSALDPAVTWAHDPLPGPWILAPRSARVPGMPQVWWQGDTWRAEALGVGKGGTGSAF